MFSSTSRLKLALVLIAGCIAIATMAPDASAQPAASPLTFVCHFDATCPEVTVAGDPPATLFGPPAPFRGYGDPSIERDPATGTLWLSYSWLNTLVDSTGPPPVLNRGVQTHLARSDDGGATFSFVRAVNTATQIDHPDSATPGWAIHEVSTLLRRAASDWQMIWLTYFAPYGDFPPGPNDGHSDVYYTNSTASSAAGLGDVAQPIIRGNATSPSFGAQYNLSALPQLSDCASFTEPALFARAGTTYLATNCVVFVGNARRPDLERLVLLRQDPGGYSYVGTLLTYADAQGLGGERLEQADIALSRNGAILLFVSPIRDQAPQTLGCIVFQITDLASASVMRDANHHAVPLATITGDPSDSLIGSGQCTYNANSSTGVLLVMHNTTNQILFSMHATGVHPDVTASVGGLAEAPSPAALAPSDRKSTPWIWLGGLMAVAAALAILILKRRRIAVDA